MCKTRLHMKKISLKFKRLIASVESSLPCVASKSGMIKKHKAVTKKQLTQPVFFCKILKSLSRRNTPLPHMEWDSMRLF